MTKRNRTVETSRASQDELTAVIRAGARKLIAQALDAEVTERLSTFGEGIGPWTCEGGPQWRPARAGDSNPHWACDSTGPEGPESPGPSGAVSFRPGPTLCAQEPQPGDCATLVVFEGDFHRGDAGGVGSVSGPRGQRAFRQHGRSIETDVAGRVRDLAAAALRTGALGLYLGGWDL